MPFDDPASIDLSSLFRDPDMFDSRAHWAKAGFQVFSRSSPGKVMVARHPAVHGLLFKHYALDVPPMDQLKNYERRLEGARRLRVFIEQHGLSRVVVPHKWILKLPHIFSRRGTAHVLVVEELEILDDKQTQAAYRHIHPRTLSELCLVIYHFPGMDSIAKNLPFTSDGGIALVDTEHWDRNSHKAPLRHIASHLRPSSYRRARKIFRKLEEKVTGIGSRRHDDDDDFGGDSSTSSTSSLS